jgi:hypothetical protein
LPQPAGPPPCVSGELAAGQNVGRRTRGADNTLFTTSQTCLAGAALTGHRWRTRRSKLTELRAVEEDLGVVIIALEHTVPLANLTSEQISLLQQLEQHGFIALACRKK